MHWNYQITHAQFGSQDSALTKTTNEKTQFFKKKSRMRSFIVGHFWHFPGKQTDGKGEIFKRDSLTWLLLGWNIAELTQYLRRFLFHCCVSEVESHSIYRGRQQYMQTRMRISAKVQQHWSTRRHLKTRPYDIDLMYEYINNGDN